ncbi:MAG: thiamine-phosphate kinase [Ktedonobacteraceae bacterium]
MNISTLGEFELIARLTAGLDTRTSGDLGVGDDCAIIDLGQGSNELLLATCDSQVEGVHFTLQTSPPEHIGRKALAINLSDIAAMGGEPRYALVSLILPSDLSLEVLDGVYAGLRAEAARYATVIIGGNIAGAGKSRQLIIDITLLGAVERGHALLRSGAQVGDLLCVTGSPGDSAAGLYSLTHPHAGYGQEDLLVVRNAHTMPRPRVNEGRVLQRFGPHIITSLLDISDGLSGDLGHICERSKVGAYVQLASLPLSPAMRHIAVLADKEPELWALHGGEDYELLFTVSPGHEQAVIEAVKHATGTPVSIIGSIVPAAEGMQLSYPDGHQEPLGIQSWDHLKH